MPRREELWRRRASVLAGLLCCAPPVMAFAAGVPVALARLQEREGALVRQAGAAAGLVRLHARAAYRLARRRDAAFLIVPEGRLAQTRAFDLALLAVRRSAREAHALQSELERVRAERQAMADAVARGESAGPSAASAPVRFRAPVRGAVVGVPGLRADPVTGGESRQEALQILARMNEPVYAPAAGIVRRVEPLPQGGFAVVAEHAGGWVSVLCGLREVQATPGAIIDPDLPLGLAGRNLDGAVVVSLELWRGRTPVDPRPLLHHRR
jgi:murein hydrolase activator